MLKSSFFEKAAIYTLGIFIAAICFSDYSASRHFLRASFFIALCLLFKNKLHFACSTRHLSLFFLFFLSLVISIFFNTVHFSYETNIAYFRTNFLLPLLTGLTTLLLVKYKTSIEKFFVPLSFSLLISNIAAIYQHSIGIDRAYGLTNAFMSLSGIFIVIFPSLVIIVSTEYFQALNKWRPLFYTTIITAIPAIIFNGTRTVWFVLPIVSLLALWMLNKKKHLFIFALIFIFMLGGICTTQYRERLTSITNMQYQSNSERLLLWQSSWQMFKDHPIVGVGLGNYATEYHSHYISPNAKEPTLEHAHSVPFHILASSGLIGITGFLLFFGYTLKESLQSWQTAKNPAALIIFCTTVSFLMQGLTEVNIGFHSVTISIYWFILSACLIITDKFHLKK